MEITHQLGPVTMTNEQYHADDGISKSHLDVIAAQSPKHYWQKYINPNRVPEPMTKAKIFGQATHTAVLEPHTMDKRIIVGLPHDRRSNSNKQAWAEFELEHAGKLIISRQEMDDLQRMVDVVWSEPEIAGLLTGGVAEQSYFAMRQVPDSKGGLLFDEETGEVIEELVKCQTDYRVAGSHIIDLKTTEDSSFTAFAKSCANFRYPVQNAWYVDTLEACNEYHGEIFLFLAIEKEPPYVMGLYPLEDVAIAEGRIAAERDFCRIVKHRRASYWPGHFRSIKESITRPLSMPRWMKL